MSFLNATFANPADSSSVARLLRGQEALGRGGEVAVGLAIAAGEPHEQRHDAAEVGGESGAHECGRGPRRIEADEAPTRLQHSHHLGVGRTAVAQVPDDPPHRDGVGPSVRHASRRRVPGPHLHGGAAAGPRGLLPRNLDHVGREVDPDDRPRPPHRLERGEDEVSRSAADVEDGAPGPIPAIRTAVARQARSRPRLMSRLSRSYGAAILSNIAPT